MATDDAIGLTTSAEFFMRHSAEGVPAGGVCPMHKTSAKVTTSSDVKTETESILDMMAACRFHADVPREQYKFTQLHGGLTNKLYKLSCPGVGDFPVLVRLYGEGSDLMIDRERENDLLKVFARAKLAAPLHLEFGNGIVYGFTPGVPMDSNMCLNPELSRMVAEAMALWHRTKLTPVKKPRTPLRERMEKQLSTTSKTPKSETSLLNIHQHAFLGHSESLWSNVFEWFDIARKLPDMYSSPDDPFYFSIDWSELQKELKELQKEAESFPYTSQIVMCHNDLLPGNIIYNKELGTMSFIDYEYASYNPRGFDIANHLAEVGFDYDTVTVKPNVPSKEQRISFLRHYFAAINNSADSPASLKLDWEDEIVGEVDREVFAWECVANIRWCLWSIIQDTHSSIDFNYKKFAQVRWERFHSMLREIKTPSSKK